MFFGFWQLADIAVFTVWRKARHRMKVIETLENPGSRSKRIPILDGQVKKLAGHPTKMQQKTARRAVEMVRFAVSTEAFEQLVAGFMNPKSRIRKGDRKIAQVSTYL